MTDPQPVIVPPVVPPVPDAAPVVDVAALTAERDKWQALSRKHEGNWKVATGELDSLKNASMSDADKAIETAKAEGRKAALTEVGNDLIKAELRVQAALKGVTLDDDFADVLNLSKLADTNGKPDPSSIEKVIANLAPKGDKFNQNLGIGQNAGGSNVKQLNRKDLQNMSYAEVNKARRDGKLDNLMNGID